MGARELKLDAKSLSTRKGYREAVVWLMREFLHVGSDLEVKALRGVKECLSMLRDERLSEQEAKHVEQLLAEHKKTQRLMTAQRGSATAFGPDAATPPMRTDAGAPTH